jgi:UDP-N-acetylglucosamine acyltransferase
MIVDGHPGKTRGVNKVGLERNGVAAEVVRVLTEAYKIVFMSGLTLAHALDKIQAELPQSKELEHFIDFCRKSERGIAR